MVRNPSSTVQGNSNGRLTLAALAEAKCLPVSFLQGIGLRDERGGVVIPYFDAAGNPTHEKRRTALVAKEGSWWPSGVPVESYGDWKLGEANRAGFLIIGEDESDGWASWYHEVPYLGIPGANNAKVLTHEHVACVGTVYVVREPGQSGDTFVPDIVARLRKVRFEGRAFELRMPDGLKDLADLHADDPARFKERLASAVEASTLLDLPPTTTATGSQLVCWQIIRNYFQRRYGKGFRRGEAVYSATERRLIRRQEACAALPPDLIEALARADDAPEFKGGGVNVGALPGFFRKWAGTAWVAFMQALPDEDGAKEGAVELAKEEFTRLVRQALLSEFTLARKIRDPRGLPEVRMELRSAIGWCQAFAKPGPWKTVRSKQLWCRLEERALGLIVLKVALRHEVFKQLHADPRLVEIGPAAFIRRATRYDIGKVGGQEDRPGGKWALVLSDDFVEDLTASFSE